MNFEKIVIDITSETLGVEKNQINLDSDFYEDLNAEKLEVIDIVLKAARDCQVELSQETVQEEINNIRTVKNLIDWLQFNSDEI